MIEEDNMVGYDGVYMSKMSAAGKKAWDTINKKKGKRTIQEIRIDMLKNNSEALKLIAELARWNNE
jgi:hypothetical protein